MRDLVAALVAIGLLVIAASLATTLRLYRRRRRRARQSERALGRTIVAELPTAEDLVLFSEDAVRFHYGDRSIDKDLITGARMLINGVPIATVESKHRAQTHAPGATDTQPDAGIAALQVEAADGAGAIDDTPEGIARDRWDVAIDTETGTVLVECGAIRERVSPELARSVFGAVKREIERRNAGDHHSVSATPAR